MALAQYHLTYDSEPLGVVIAWSEDAMTVARAIETRAMSVKSDVSLPFSSFCFERPQPLPDRPNVERPEDV